MGSMVHCGVETAASQLLGSLFDPDPGLLSVWRFGACSPHVHVSFLWVFRIARLLPDSQNHTSKWISNTDAAFELPREQ